MEYTLIETTADRASELCDMLTAAGYVNTEQTVDAIFLERDNHRITIIERGIGEVTAIETMPWMSEEEYSG